MLCTTKNSTHAKSFTFTELSLDLKEEIPTQAISL